MYYWDNCSLPCPTERTGSNENCLQAVPGILPPDCATVFIYIHCSSYSYGTKIFIPVKIIDSSSGFLENLISHGITFSFIMQYLQGEEI